MKQKKNAGAALNLHPEIALEDLPHDEIIAALRQIGKEAGRRAIAESKALGLAVTFVENDLIIKEYPDGTREVLGTVSPSVQVTKGSIYETKP